MKDPRIQKLAEMLVSYSVNIQPGQKVVIRGSSLAGPLIDAVYTQVLQAGGHPFLLMNTPNTEELMYRHASEEQLAYINPTLLSIIETYDAMITIMSDGNTRALTSVDPQRLALRRKAGGNLTRRFLERSAQGELRWTLCLFPTEAYAQDADMSLSEYEDFVYSACMPDANDPVGYWRKVSARQDRIIDWLKDKRTIHVKGPETDLTLSVAGRKFINCDCRVNVPDGEIYTGPVEDSANGHVYFSYPAIFGGREVTGVRLWFENGCVVKATAEKEEPFLLRTLDTDEGARRIGEFAIGTNDGISQFTRQILFDEKIGGSFHMALGASYPESGGTNQSALHWDMICDLRDGGEIWADDQLLYQNGKFVIKV